MGLEYFQSFLLEDILLGFCQKFDSQISVGSIIRIFQFLSILFSVITVTVTNLFIMLGFGDNNASRQLNIRRMWIRRNRDLPLRTGRAKLWVNWRIIWVCAITTKRTPNSGLLPQGRRIKRIAAPPIDTNFLQVWSLSWLLSTYLVLVSTNTYHCLFSR